LHKFSLKVPVFRHSDYKIIGNKINIIKYKNYYFNKSNYYKKATKEFKTKRYQTINHDNKIYYDQKKKKFIFRSIILSSIIKKKFKNKNLNILDYGCSKGNLLIKLSKIGFNNLYGYDVGKYHSNFLLRKKIIFLRNLSQKKKFFDIVIFSHSIAYLKNIKKSLVNIKKIVKPNGILIVNIQNVEKRPLNLLFGDQRYHFTKKMAKFFFGKYGSIKFLKDKLPLHELLFFLKLKDQKSKKNNDYFNAVLAAKLQIKKINQITKPLNILGTNVNSALAILLLKSKVKKVVIEKNKTKNFFLKKKIIGINEHKKTNIPLLINFGDENNLIISRLKKKFNISKFITI
tara:strand:+ start:622 stop:1653 length:1032 start_codon:yes stop_codon:yes gene_type:complete